MPRPNDLSKSPTTLEQESTLIAVVEMSRGSWLVAGIVPGIERHPLKKLNPEEADLLQLLCRWQDEALRAGRTVKRIVVAFEAGRDGFWLARWLRHVRSKPMSSIRQASRFRASIAGRKRTGWTLSC